MSLFGYTHKIKIPVGSSSDGELTNYQIKLILVKGAGTNTSTTAYLDNHCLNWPYDIRFTSADGTTLIDFWREEYDETDGTWWIEVPTIPASGGTAVYLYYGNSGATDVSNGDNTFEFFDDFPGSSLDTDKWNYSGSIGVADSEVTIGGAEEHIREKTEVSMPFRVRAKSKVAGEWASWVTTDRVNHKLGEYFIGYTARFSTYNAWYAVQNGSGHRTEQYVDYYHNNYKITEILAKSTSVVIIDDGTVVGTVTTEANIPSGVGQGVKMGASSANCVCDWIFRAKYAVDDPALSAGIKGFNTTNSIMW